MPDNEDNENGSNLSNIGTVGNFRCLAVPCCRNKRPDMIRRMLSRRGDQVTERASRFIGISEALRSALHEPVSTARQVKLTRLVQLARLAPADRSDETVAAARPRAAARRAVATRAGSDRSCPAAAAR